MNKLKFLFLLLPFNLAAESNCLELVSKLGMGAGKAKIRYQRIGTKLQEFVEDLRDTHKIAFQESCGLCEISLRPFQKLVSLHDFEVVASPSVAPVLKKLAARIILNMQTFDQKVQQWGFVVPESNRVLFWDRTGRERSDVFGGVYYPMYPVFNFWRGKMQNLTVFETVKDELDETIKYANDRSVLFHERTHASIFRTYNSKAFINTHIVFQEAMADFFSAHALDDPGIMPLSSNTFLRDISTKSYYVEALEKTFKITDLADVSEFTLYSNSMLISNVLWRVREIIGSDRMSKMLRPLIDNLNGYRASFEAQFMDFEVLKGIENSEKYIDYVDYRDKFANDFQYFLAVLKRTAKDTENFIKVDQVVTGVADDLKLNSNRIDYIAGHIKKGDDLFAYNKREITAVSRNMLFKSFGYLLLENNFWFASGAVLGYGIGVLSLL